MRVYLSPSDLGGILESLRYTKMRFQEYSNYPSPEYKQKQIAFIDAIMDKLKTQIERNAR